MAMAQVHLGLTRDDALDATFEELGVMFKLYGNSEQMRMRQDWERARFIAFNAVSPHVKGIRRATDLITFDWEKPDMDSLKKVDFDKIFPKKAKG
jgi:hypothetical protein